jgi:hypothetical protein
MEMASLVAGKEAAGRTEPIGLLTEGAAGIAAVVLSILGLAGVAAGDLASIAVIVIGVGLIVQGFNAGAEQARALTATTRRTGELGGDVMVDFVAGGAGIVLGILALIGVHAPYLVPAALIVFGGALLLAGTTPVPTVSYTVPAPAAQPATEAVYPAGSAATRGLEILIGLASIVLGILSLIFMTSWVLALVGMLATGAALLVVSASFSGAVFRLVTA